MVLLDPTLSLNSRGSSPLPTAHLTATTKFPLSTSPLAEIPKGAKVLWVTSTGGHLAELAAISEGLEAGTNSLWVTFDSTQSREFLEGRRRMFVDYVAPRDLRGAVKAMTKVASLLRLERFDACLSTGAAVAATILPLAALAGIPTYYVESLARPSGPSFTGKILARAPRVRTLTQYREWSSAAWPYGGTSLDDFEASTAPPVAGPLKILVTLGTIAPFRFDRAVDAVLRMLKVGDEVTWQLGSTTRTDLPGRCFDQVTPTQMAQLSRESDVVVAHCGVGSVLQQFGVGNSPVLAVRSRANGEHVDDHQAGLASVTSGRGLTSRLDLDRPSRLVLLEAAARVISARQPSRLSAVR